MQNSVLTALTLVEIWSLFAVFCFLKLVSDTIIQGKVKMTDQAFGYPEDQKMMGKGAAKPLVTSENQTLAMRRADGLFRNDLENLIPFAILSLAAALVQACANETYIAVLLIFGIGRILHAYFMMKGRQPHRNLSYQLGNLAQLAMVFLILRHIWMRA